MPGTEQSGEHLENSQQIVDVVMQFYQGHTTGKWLSQNSDPSLCDRKTKRNKSTYIHIHFPQAAAATGARTQNSCSR